MQGLDLNFASRGLNFFKGGIFSFGIKEGIFPGFMVVLLQM